MVHSLQVAGSLVRDFCVLERNFLSHFKLILLLMLLSSSALLGVHLPGPTGSTEQETLGKASLPVAILQVLAAFGTIAAAIWEYQSGVKGLLGKRAFLTMTRVHFWIMVVMTAMIIASAVIFVVHRV